MGLLSTTKARAVLIKCMFFRKSGKIRTTLQISAGKRQMSDLLSKALFRDKKNKRVKTLKYITFSGSRTLG